MDRHPVGAGRLATVFLAAAMVYGAAAADPGAARQALKASPDDQGALLDYGIALAAAHRDSEATAVAERLLRVQPLTRDAAVFALYGRGQERRDPWFAEWCYRQAVECATTDGAKQIYGRLSDQAHAAQQGKPWAEPKSSLDLPPILRWQRAHADDFNATTLLVAALLDAERYVEAETALRPWQAKLPDDNTLCYGLVLALAGQGRHTEALEIGAKALPQRGDDALLHSLLAECHLSLRQLDEAVAEAEAGLKIKANEKLHRTLVDARQEQGKWAEGLEAVRKGRPGLPSEAPAAEPPDAQWFWYLWEARLQWGAGNRAAVARLLPGLKHMGPEDREVRLLAARLSAAADGAGWDAQRELADALSAAGQFDEVEAAWQRAIAGALDSAAALQCSSDLLRLGLVGLAETAARRAVVLAADDAKPAAQKALAEALLGQHRLAAAAEAAAGDEVLLAKVAAQRAEREKRSYPPSVVAARDKAQQDPQPANAHNLWAIALSGAGFDDEAEELGRAVLERFPGNGPLLGNLAGYLRKLGRYNEAALNAVASLHATVQRSGVDEAFSYSTLGRSQLELGHHAAAEEALRQAVAKQPQISANLVYLATALRNNGQCGEAEVLDRQAVDLKPDGAWEHNELGLTLNQQERWYDAEVEFRAALRAKPDNATYAGNVGDTLNHQELYPLAEVCLEPAVAKYTANSRLPNLLGHALYNQQLWDPAAAAYRTAIERSPRDSVLHANLAGALLRAGKREEARAVAQHAIELGNRSHWVYKELGLKP
ncbi:MAG: tetratricopeptide repeat protein [Armatimonadetes bacterium]|nr:tetratricopeptide repeat protein [Armatimonadota bacterium]